MQRRAFVLVIDACGVGESPDAARCYGGGAGTLRRAAHAVAGLEPEAFGRRALAKFSRCRARPEGRSLIAHA
jgi:phosphopentomutase